ncbi:MAG TPA: arginine deiminase family protein [Pyrinomonadaceae bacterium]|nr:arginine deiminase family protein [Pyrinomonadaceae bacterium]
MDLAGNIGRPIFGMTSLGIATKEELATHAIHHAHSIKQTHFKAITRGVSRKIAACELTYRSREDVNFERAAIQLEHYCELLRKWGVDLMPIAASDTHPDCCFVQDTAVVLDEVCVIASMGAPARLGEVSEVERLIAPLRKIMRILPPATLDGGDVVQFGKRLYVGLSSRTNARGISALEKIVEVFGYSVVPVVVTGGLHLTTGCGIVNDETVLLNPRWLDASAFRDLRQLHVPEQEPWAANTIRVDDAVCVEQEAPRTVDLIQPYAGSIDTLDISEFRKAEGSLSCLSLIFKDALIRTDTNKGDGDGTRW